MVATCPRPSDGKKPIGATKWTVRACDVVPGNEIILRKGNTEVKHRVVAVRSVETAPRYRWEPHIVVSQTPVYDPIKDVWFFESYRTTEYKAVRIDSPEKVCIEFEDGYCKNLKDRQGNPVPKKSEHILPGLVPVVVAAI